MKTRLGLWLLGIAVLAVTLIVLAASGRFQIDSDLLALLPAPQQDPVESAALNRMTQLGERRLVVLIRGADDGQRARTAQAVAQALSSSRAFGHVATGVDDLLDRAQREKLKQLYSEHRFHLLAPADARALGQLTNTNPDDASAARTHFMDRAKTRLYGLGLGTGGHFSDDPLGLENAYRSATARNPAVNLRLTGTGRFYVQDDQNQRYAVVFAKSRQDPFALSAQTAQIDALDRARAAAEAAAPQTQLLISGVIRHAAAASSRAQTEVSIIGTGSLIGIVLLMAWAFGGIRPFVLSITAVAGGILLAAVTTRLIFGGIHMLTLVFGASLVGVSIDYCLHFSAQRLQTPEPWRALTRILPAVTLGLITSVLAYGGMAIAPFPGLRQIAVFTTAGLIGAWLGTVLLLPALAGRAPRPGTALQLAGAWRIHGPARLAVGHERRVLWGMAAMLVLFAIPAILWLAPDDDIRVLYNPLPALVHADREVSQLLGSRLSTRAIIVRGASPAAVLERESALVRAIEQSGKSVAQADAITQVYPPPAVQRRHYDQLARTLYAENGPVSQLLDQAGFSRQRIDAAWNAFRHEQDKPLALNDWLDSPASAGLRDLWLGTVDGQWASLIRLQQVDDPGALARILERHPQATEIDRVAEISSLMSRYRSLVSWMLGVEYILAGLLLCWRFGVRGALSLLLPPMLASVLVATIFAATGWAFSLFNLIGLILLLGLGADYGIFLRMTRRGHAPAMLAVGLSVATTLLAFGLLALSHTPALHGFGLTLALGLVLTFLLASIVDGTTTRPTPSSTGNHGS